MQRTAHLLELIGQFGDTDRRQQVARAVARELGAETLMLFVQDPELGVPLPAPGFPQTLPGGRAWRTFLAGCQREREQCGILPSPDGGSATPALGLATADGTVLVLLGGAPHRTLLGPVLPLLPLMAAAVVGERARLTAAAHERVAREAAAQAETLTRALDSARTRLQGALAEAEAARRRAAFLAEATSVLSASLDHDTTLASVAALTVASVADVCVVDVLEDGGVIRRVDVACADPGLQWLADEIRRFTPEITSPHPIAAALRTGVPRLIPEVTPEVMRELAQDDEQLAVVQRSGARAFLVVPLIARGRTLGGITLVAIGERRRYDEHDLAFVQELARRAAFAVDNARLYRVAERAREDAERANSAKSQFLAVMSHEIRTPLNAIVGYTELVDVGLAGPVTADQRRYLERVRSSSAHLLGLIDEILDLSKIESERMPVLRVRAAAAEVAGEAMTIVRPQAAQKGIRLAEQGPRGRAPEFVGDPQRVKQVLVNLLTNAVKFTPAGGRVTLRYGSSTAADVDAPPGTLSAWAFFRVEDTGVGISSQDVGAIFEPFVQSDMAHTRRQGGVGLGLTISLRLARLMGGELTVRSTPGEGSVFTLWLPLPDRE